MTANARISVLATLAALFSLIASLPLSATGAAEPAGTVRILVPSSTAALPFLLMAREDRVRGVDVVAETYANNAQALALFLRGEADLLCAGTSQGWENRQDGSPIQILGTGVWGTSSLIGVDARIKSFADLKGKRLALPFPGSPLDFQTRAMLVREGLEPDTDLQISYGAFPQSLARLASGQLDAAAMPEPQATTAVRVNGLARLLVYADAWARWSGGKRESPQVSLFATESFAAANTELLSRFVKEWSSASKRITDAPEDLVPQFAEVLATSPEVLVEASRNTIFLVEAFDTNKRSVADYYGQVSQYFPREARPLDDGFFFIP